MAGANPLASEMPLRLSLSQSRGQLIRWPAQTSKAAEAARSVENNLTRWFQTFDRAFFLKA
jgi:hypothetical protein